MLAGFDSVFIGVTFRALRTSYFLDAERFCSLTVVFGINTTAICSNGPVPDGIFGATRSDETPNAMRV